MKNILLTGGSSGIGKELKDIFLKNGHKVYALDILEMEKQSNYS